MKPTNWWTWNADRPVEFSHLASGYRIQPVIFSARAERAWIISPGDDLAFGPRRIGGGEAQFTTCFQDTVLNWRYGFGPDGGGAIGWKAGAHGEWGLRYWIAICVVAPPGVTLRHDRATGAITGSGACRFDLRPDSRPAMVTAHASVADVVADFEDHGYFHLGARGDAGAVLALRFNLEQAPEARIGISIDGAAPPAPEAPPAGSPGTHQQALQAIHDVMAWNHVHDAVNDRPYTVLSRFWNTRKFGGFGVWLSDILYNAMLWSLFDPDAALENVEAVFAWQTEEGNFPCLVTGNDAWLDRSQIPTAAFVAWSVFTRTGDRAFLERAYPAVRRNHDWWRRRRSLGDTGFVTYGTSLDVGDGLYKGTKFGAQNESSMDNSPVHEAAAFDAETGLLQTIDVGLNSLYALDAEMLGHMAEALGRGEDAARHRTDHAALAQRISEHLWDPERQVFANRLPDGAFIEALIPTSFYPMVAGAATAAQARALNDRYITAPDKFGGRFGLPSTARDHPAFHDNCYWRGRIWAPMNYWTWLGLRRMRMADEAADLAARGWAVFEQGWRQRRCGENYHADTGEIHDQPDTDGFYSWGALFPAMTVHEILGLDPWDGLSVAPALAGSRFGPVRTQAGEMTITRAGADWTVLIDGDPLIAGNVAGRLKNLVVTAGAIGMDLPEGPAGEWIAFPGRAPVRAMLDDAPQVAADGRIDLSRRRAAVRLRVELDASAAPAAPAGDGG